MDVELTRKTWCVFGYKESGKSILAKTIAARYGSKALYYDVLHEVPETAAFHAYQPKNRHNVQELESIIKLVKNGKQYRMFIIDEANRYCPPKPRVLPDGVADMNDWCRHPQYNLSVGYIARRPVQINTDLVEIADYLFIFQLGGKNDLQYLNDLRSGLGDAVLNLPPHHFALVYPNRTWKIFNPVKVDKIYIGSDTRTLTSGRY